MTGGFTSALRDEAAEWVARMDAGDWGDADETRLQNWLAGDPRRSGALLQAQAAWATLDHSAGQQHETSIAWQARKPDRRAILAGGGAAVVASLIGGAFWVDSGARYATTVGEVRRVPLADGSTVAINTGSQIEVRLRKAERDIRLDRGEAWFQVAKDARRPFLVEAGRVRVQAVGTAFSVRRRDAGADVLVTEGVVETWVDGAEGHRVRLNAGQRAFVADNAAIMTQDPTPSSVDRALAWRAGKIDLAGEKLTDAIAEINRYNQRHVVLLDPSLGDEELDGVFRTDDPEGFAIAVQSTFDVPVDTSDRDEIRIGHRRP